MQVGASLRDIQIGITAAIVESGLRNLDYGDRDSIGMFQQRDAWGSRADRLDPYKSARMFFLGGAAGQRGLLDFDDRTSMSMGQAAQAVQVSAFPDRYAEHQAEAGNLLNTLSPGATQFTSGDTSDPLGDLGAGGTAPGLAAPPAGTGRITPQVSETIVPAPSATAALSATTNLAPGLEDTLSAQANAIQTTTVPGQSGMQPLASVEDYQSLIGDQGLAPNLGQSGVDQGRLGLVNYAKQFLGTPYVWGGNSLENGVDCSGLVQQVFQHFGINLPRVSYQQANAGKRVALGQLRPGDLVAWNNSSRNNGADHIAIYAGNGMVIEAPRPGRSVQLVHLYDTGNAWGVRLKI